MSALPIRRSLLPAREKKKIPQPKLVPDFADYLAALASRYGPGSPPPAKDPIKRAHWLGYRLGLRNGNHLRDSLSQSIELIEFMRAYKVGFQIWKRENPYGW